MGRVWIGLHHEKQNMDQDNYFMLGRGHQAQT